MSGFDSEDSPNPGRQLGSLRSDSFLTSTADLGEVNHLSGRQLGSLRSSAMFNTEADLKSSLKKAGGRPSIDEMMLSRQTGPLRSFARQLLIAFHEADVYAAKRFDVRSRTTGRRRGTSLSTLSIGMFSMDTEEGDDPRNLKSIHSSCIEGAIDTLVRLIGVAAFEDDKDKVKIALDGDPSELAPSITCGDVISALQSIEETFLGVVHTVQPREGKKKPRRNYSPDWKTRNMIWCLIRSVVSVFK